MNGEIDEIEEDVEKMTLRESAKKIRQSVVRVLVFNMKNRLQAVGTGFLYKENLFLTCAHVVFLSEGQQFEQALCRLKDDNAQLISIFMKRVSKIVIMTEEGENLGKADLDDLDLDHDAVTLKVDDSKSIPVVQQSDTKLEIGDKVAFCGFPSAPFYKDMTTYPFMLNEGIVSGFPNQEVGGFPKYEHVQINAVSVGGFSGSPVFEESNGQVLGFINGSRSTRVMAARVIEGSNMVKNGVVAEVPIGIAYATKLDELSFK